MPNAVRYKLRMKDLPPGERPYEKMEIYGPDVLSNAELLAIIIRTGNRQETSVELAQRLLKMSGKGKGLSFLCEMSLDELRKVRGIGKVKAVQLKAVMELCKRLPLALSGNEKAVIRSSRDISNMFMEEMRFLEKEEFRAVLLNVRNMVMRWVRVSVGSLTSSVVHPREAFREAVRSGCASVIFVHNHPSGDPSPSREDLEITSRLVKGGEILGIRVLDHIIIGNGIYVSLKDENLMQGR